MLDGTTAAFRYPYRRQVPVDSDRVLTTQDLNGVIVVDSSTGPVTVTLPSALPINAGSAFLIFAPRADLNPVTVRVQAGDTYNDGMSADVVMTTIGEQLLVLGQSNASTWLYLQGIGPCPAIAGNGYSVTTAAAVSVPGSGSGAFGEIPGPYALDPNPLLFQQDGGNPARLQYIGVPTVQAEISASASLEVALGIVEGRIRIAKNGVTIPSTEAGSQVIAGFPFNIATFASVTLETNDTISLYATNLTNASLIESVGVRVLAKCV